MSHPECDAAGEPSPFPRFVNVEKRKIGNFSLLHIHKPFIILWGETPHA
jgi:hypothetical protein